MKVQPMSATRIIKNFILQDVVLEKMDFYIAELQKKLKTEKNCGGETGSPKSECHKLWIRISDPVVCDGMVNHDGYESCWCFKCGGVFACLGSCLIQSIMMQCLKMFRCDFFYFFM